MLISGLSYSQKVVSELSDIKKPKNGKLYFSEKENRLAIYMNGQYFTFFQASKIEKPDTKPENPKPDPVPEPPAVTETIVGYWDSPDRLLVLYPINGNTWLLQTSPDRAYYVPRGKNLLVESRTVVTGTYDYNQIAGNETQLGGLYQSDNFPESEFLKITGRVKNSFGEYVLPGGETPAPGGGDNEKISIPVGVIMWSGWHTTLSPDDPIDITKETRYALSLPQTRNQAPFYSTYHAPEVLNKHRWNQDYKRWEWDKVTATVRFNGDRPGVIEKQVDYAVSAGIDYFLFNYYTDATPMSIERRQFEALPNKRGLKGAYLMENIGGDPQTEAKRIAAAFRQDWYQKIDGKPLLVLPASGSYDFDRIYAVFQAIKQAYGGEIYTVLQMMGYPVEMAGEIRKRGYDSHSRYSTWGGWNQGDRSHRYIMDREWEWYQDSKKQSVDFTPNITTSFYQYGAKVSWGEDPENYSEKATDAEVHEQWRRLAQHVKGNPQVKTVYAYSWNEFSEGGRTICPQLRTDGTIDDSTLKIIAQYLN